jgi:hypothetical protein
MLAKPVKHKQASRLKGHPTTLPLTPFVNPNVAMPVTAIKEMAPLNI